MSVRSVKVVRPRPLKMGGGTQPELGPGDLAATVETVTRSLAASSSCGQQLVSQLETLTANLRISGPQLETSHKELMEGLNTALLSGCKEERWPLVARVHMLHLLELRSLGWRPSPHTSQYYRDKLDQALAQQQASTAPVISASSSLNSEAKEFNPFRSSLQRSSSANNAFSGANNNNPSRSELKTNINNNTATAESDKRIVDKLLAKMSAATKPAPAPAAEKKCSLSVRIGDDVLTVSGDNVELVKTAKIVLNEFFNVIPSAGSTGDGAAKTGDNLDDHLEDEEEEEEEASTIELIPPKISYNKEQLMAMATSPFSLQSPGPLASLAKELPGVVRRGQEAVTRPLGPTQGPTSKLILREMEGLRRQEEAKHV